MQNSIWKTSTTTIYCRLYPQGLRGESWPALDLWRTTSLRSVCTKDVCLHTFSSLAIKYPLNFNPDFKYTIVADQYAFIRTYCSMALCLHHIFLCWCAFSSIHLPSYWLAFLTADEKHPHSMTQPSCLPKEYCVQDATQAVLLVLYSPIYIVISLITILCLLTLSFWAFSWLN